MPLVPPPRDVNLIGVTWREWWIPTARGWAVLVTGLWCITRGLSYLDPAANIVPLNVYAEMLPPSAAASLQWFSICSWTLVGILIIGQLMRRRWRVGMTAAVAIHTLWALGAVLTWVILGEPRAWFTAARDAQAAVLISAVSIMLDPMRPTRRSKR